MKLTTFASREEFRAWLQAHHASVKELQIRLDKSHARDSKSHAPGNGLTYREALDESLCFGWIDGVRRRHDERSFVQRFSPRRAKSFWSRVNIKRYRELEAEGRVAAPGRAAFEARDRKTKGKYSFESKPTGLAPVYLRKLRAQPRAWTFFEGCPPWYRRLCAFFVMSAKKPETREARLARLIAASARGLAISPILQAKIAARKSARR
jgi:uncharacterized protein YdeI (YjbR/CyaY-like superfamily)